MRIVSFIIIAVLLANSVYAVDHYFEFVLQEQNGKVKLLSTEIKIGSANWETYGPYHYEVLSFNNSILAKASFDFPREMIIDSWTEGPSIVKLENSTVTLRIPYYDQGKEIVFFANDSKVLSINISGFAKLPETLQTMPVSKERAIQPAPELAVQEEKKPITQHGGFWVFVFLVLLFIAALFFVRVRKIK